MKSINAQDLQAKDAVKDMQSLKREADSAYKKLSKGKVEINTSDIDIMRKKLETARGVLKNMDPNSVGFQRLSAYIDDASNSLDRMENEFDQATDASTA